MDQIPSDLMFWHVKIVKDRNRLKPEKRDMVV